MPRVREVREVLREQSLIERYRERAAELRAFAQDIADKKRRELLIKVAEDYERLAEPGNVLGRANRPFSES